MNFKIIATLAFMLSTAALAHDPVTDIEAFQCHPRGTEQKYIAWTEKTTSGQIVTLGKLGASGVESFEKFTGSRLNTDDTVIINSNDGDLSLIIDNVFDGEFYSASLSVKRGNATETQEFACESHTPTPVSLVDAPAAGRRSLMNYVYTCTAAPYNNYSYRWFYWQSYNLYYAQSQALGYCNSFYGAPICVYSCR